MVACRKRDCLPGSICTLPAVCMFSLRMHVAKALRDHVQLLKMSVLRCKAETTPYIGRNIEVMGASNKCTNEGVIVSCPPIDDDL